MRNYEEVLNEINIAALAAGITMLSVPVDCRIPCRGILILLFVLEVISFIEKHTKKKEITK